MQRDQGMTQQEADEEERLQLNARHHRHQQGEQQTLERGDDEYQIVEIEQYGIHDRCGQFKGIPLPGITGGSAVSSERHQNALITHISHGFQVKQGSD